MLELLKLEDETVSCYSPDYYESLLEYVEIIADIYKPLSPEDYDCGLVTSKALGNFVYRYFENKIDKSFEKKFLENKEIQEIITTLGYDVDKFWYLLLFVNDFSCGMCVNGIVPNKSIKEHLEEFSTTIFENLDNYNNTTKEISFKTSTKIVLEINEEQKIVIEDANAIIHLAEMFLIELDKIKTGSFLSQSKTEFKIKKGVAESQPNINSIHIWYFANMLLKFFDIKPPKIVRQKKDSQISYNRRFLISRFIFMVKLSRNESFDVSKNTLQGYLKPFKNFNLDVINGIYF